MRVWYPGAGGGQSARGHTRGVAQHCSSWVGEKSVTCVFFLGGGVSRVLFFFWRKSRSFLLPTLLHATYTKKLSDLRVVAEGDVVRAWAGDGGVTKGQWTTTTGYDPASDAPAATQEMDARGTTQKTTDRHAVRGRDMHRHGSRMEDHRAVRGPKNKITAARGAAGPGPAATHPPAICQNSGGGGVQGAAGGGAAGFWYTWTSTVHRLASIG